MPTRPLEGTSRRGRRRRARPAVDPLEPRRLLADWTVTDFQDTGAEGTLRWAIGQVNLDLDPTSRITFELDGQVQTIRVVATALPEILRPVSIDGTLTRPDSTTEPGVVIDGSDLTSSADHWGLALSGGDSTVAGLSIGGFANSPGLLLKGGGRNRVVGSTFGVRNLGSLQTLQPIVLPNGQGIRIEASSVGNTIGGAEAGQGNVISGNGGDGLEINGSSRNLVLGNRIGTDRGALVTLTPGGTPEFALIGNGQNGINLQPGSTGNTIGGTAEGARNVISGNQRNGIALNSDPGAPIRDNRIEGNFIGTDATGLLALPNRTRGIAIANSARDNTIGGAGAGQGNVISGNGLGGIRLFNAADQTVIQGNRIGVGHDGERPVPNNGDGILVIQSSRTILGGADAGAGNVISGNFGHGILITEVNEDSTSPISAAASGNLVRGNIIGLSGLGRPLATDGDPLGNLRDGIRLEASGNIIGGLADGEGNTIALNGGNGVYLLSHAVSGVVRTTSDHNAIQNNRIGLPPEGAVGAAGRSVGNFQDGILLVDASDNRVVDNLVAANRQSGIHLTAGSTRNRIRGNTIGLEPGGTAGEGNYLHGVFLEDAPRNTIGGGGERDGNVVSNNGSHGVTILRSDHNTLQGNIIGLDPSGTQARPNAQHGVVLSESRGNRIGGDRALEGNTISGNQLNGLLLRGPDTTGNSILGNRIGTDRAGDAAVANQESGIKLEGASRNTIGGEAAGARNLIAGNASAGVEVQAGSNRNLVLGNWIGLGQAGDRAVANFIGVLIAAGASHNTIGGTAPGAGNVISGNHESGIELRGGARANAVEGNQVGTDAAGLLPVHNRVGISIQFSARHNTIGGTAPGAGNVLSGNRIAGVLITGIDTHPSNATEENRVEGNLIGLAGDGRTSIPNLTGVLIQAGARRNTIGGTAAGAGNIIAANLAAGVEIAGLYASEELPTTGNRVEGNFIGTDPAGTETLGNLVGVLIQAGARGNTIGGTAPGARNILAGNYGAEVIISGVGAIQPQRTERNHLVGNSIGTDPGGTRPLKDDGLGVIIEAGARDNTIGGTDPGAGNLISGSRAAGVQITGAGAQPGEFTTGNRVEGNFIGTNAAGTAPIGQRDPALGNFIGVRIEVGARANHIGGTAAGAGNLISGNLDAGILIRDPFSGRNTIQGNLIGTDARGLGSIRNGVGIRVDGASDNTIGGTELGARNILSGNGGAGIVIEGIRAEGVQVLGNWIGPDATGAAVAGRQTYGIRLIDAVDNTIGGTADGSRNVISGNTVGIAVTGFTVEFVPRGGVANQIQGNWIGLAADGINPLGNETGVYLEDVPSNQVTANTIAANATAGLYILGRNARANLVQGNRIGLNAAGTTVGNLPRGATPLQGIGVFVEDGQSNTIGGTGSGQGNLISGNNIGVYLFGNGGTNSGNQVLGNRIGLGPTGNRGGPGNGIYGVLLYNAPSNNVPRSGRSANRISGGSIAPFRNFVGRVRRTTNARAQRASRPT